MSGHAPIQLEMHRFAPWHWLAPAIALFVMAFGSLTSGSGEQGELQQLIARGQARDLHPLTVTTALYGSLHEQLANASYTHAAQLADSVHDRIWDSDACRPDRWSEAMHAPDMIELRRAWQPILDLIAEGAHARQLATEPAWHIPWLSTIVGFECYSLLQQQLEQHALNIWLDSVVMTVDAIRTASNPPQISRSNNELEQLADFWTAERLVSLSTGAKQRMAEALAKLEQRLGSSCDLERFVCTAAKHLTNPGFYDWFPVGWQQRLSAWQDGFSPQQSYVRKAEAVARRLPDLVPAEIDWPARQRQLAVLRFDPEWHAQIITFERRHRRALASLRQLRGTLLQQSGQPTATLTDPLGIGQLHIEPR
ncbi:MAG: hypothetical protein ACI89X_000846 [Planctomycetota bacterium]|jgi:hypothetical protein